MALIVRPTGASAQYSARLRARIPWLVQRDSVFWSQQHWLRVASSGFGTLVPTMAQPTVTKDHLVFTFEDPDRSLARVSLYCDDAIDGRRRFRRTSSGWSLSAPRPDLNRVEYRF